MDCHEFYNTYSCTITPGTFKSANNAKAVLAILAFAVIMWVTEAVSYPVSATLIIGLMILLLGFSPVQNLGEKLGNPKSGSAVLAGSDLLGTNHALSLAFSGFATSAVALVAAALFWLLLCKKRICIKD